MKSKIQNNQECYFCKRLEPLQLHHIMNGPNRKNSEKYKDICTVWLCPKHHEEVHNNQVLDEYLKRTAQELFEHKYDHCMWMRIFKKNYL